MPLKIVYPSIQLTLVDSVGKKVDFCNHIVKTLGLDGVEVIQERAENIGKNPDYREKFANPYVAASRGYIDDVIEPRETRPRLINALEMLQNKRDENPPKKHGNIPL